jgi:hypothetical protein
MSFDSIHRVIHTCHVYVRHENVLLLHQVVKHAMRWRNLAKKRVGTLGGTSRRGT